MIHFHHSQGVYQAANLHKGHNKRTDIAKSYGQNIRARGLHRFWIQFRLTQRQQGRMQNTDLKSSRNILSLHRKYSVKSTWLAWALGTGFLGWEVGKENGWIWVYYNNRESPDFSVTVGSRTSSPLVFTATNFHSGSYPSFLDKETEAQKEWGVKLWFECTSRF